MKSQLSGRLPAGLANRLDGGCLWGLAGIVVGGVAFAGLVVFASLNRNANSGISALPELTIIPRNTDAPILIAPTAQGTESAIETQIPFENVTYAQGDLVEVSGTGGAGLRLRIAPDLDAAVNILALEHEVYEVRGGPTEADGYTWWFLVNPYDNGIQGWSVANFLREVNP